MKILKIDLYLQNKSIQNQSIQNQSMQNNNLWLYEYPLWVSCYNDTKLFGLLPPEIIKYIIDNVMKYIIQKRQISQNLKLVKDKIVNAFHKDIKTLHFIEDDKYNMCDINTAKSILKNLSKKMNKLIKISHVCCDGKGIVFNYIENITCKPCENNTIKNI